MTTHVKSGGWRLGAFMSATWAGLRTQLAQVPKSAWGLWFMGLVLGFGVCTVLVYLVTYGARTWEALNAWDIDALHWVVAMAPIEFADSIMYESPGNLLYLGPLILVASAWFISRGQALNAISLLVGYLLQRPLVLLGWSWWDRSRPTLIADGVASPAFHSFPSGHAAMSTFTYGFLVFLWIRSTSSITERFFAAALGLGWVLMVAVGRLRMGSHWPSDMIAGFVIALAWLTVMIVLHRFLEKRQAAV